MSQAPVDHAAPAQPRWSAWRTVMWFGVVSLAADMVYEGARSITGPYLAHLGASALVVGVVTGIGEAAALLLRLVSGPAADRTGAYWPLAIGGYGLTCLCVPLMAVAPFVGGAGLVLASTLVILERTGKAIRSPSKSALLAHAARAVGRGRGFGVHKALDQVGAFAGPLVVAGVVALWAREWLGLAALAIPGVVAMLLLARIHHVVPDLTIYDPPPVASMESPGLPVGTRPVREPLPPAFHRFALACALSTLGLMTWGIIGYHLVAGRLVTTAVVPVVYAGAMLAEGAIALGVGQVYDRVGPRILLLLPVLVAAVPLLTLAPSLGVVLAGVLVWAAATSVQDSTVKALVAELVPAGRLATAYGVFAAWQGIAALAGGVLAGWLYSGGRTDLVLVIALSQVASLVLLVRTLRRA